MGLIELVDCGLNMDAIYKRKVFGWGLQTLTGLEFIPL